MEKIVSKDVIKISVLIPCYNERQFIESCLESIIANDYSGSEIEILIIDGMSEDGTRDVLMEYERRYSFIKTLDNPRRITSCALNIGIRHSMGDVIVWLSAHNIYENKYLTKCVGYLKEFNVDCVGGVIKTLPRGRGTIATAASLVLSHPFGVGNSYFRTGSSRPRYTDAVFGCCFKKTVFEKIGLFNEDLVRGQDIEFGLRMKKAGLKTLLAPDIVSYYYARSDFVEFCRHNFINGLWAILPFRYSKIIPVSWRHVTPFIFVTSIISLTILAFFSKGAQLGLAALLGIYVALNLFFSVTACIRRRDFCALFVMPFMFAALLITPVQDE